MTRLCDATLDLLPVSVARPRYERSKVQTGIVHLGVGNFHRAHEAVFVDDALGAGALDWGITAASLRNPGTRDALAPQDGLYALALNDSDGRALRVIGSIREVLVGPENPAALLAAMADPAVRIVSLTITEKGYTTNVATGGLILDDPTVRHDLANPDRPISALGYLAEALARRRAAGTAPFTILSCDNLAGNGHVLHRVLTEFATARDKALGQFIADEVACPATMVDRIVPATTDADRDGVSVTLGLKDAWPVMAEPFFQWVIEDHFPMGRPDWEASGVTFTRHAAPYEAMKLRLLNGAHSTIAAMGRVAGLATVAEAAADPAIRGMVRAYWDQVATTIAPEIDVVAYTTRLLARFDNTALQHKTAQIATDASLKLPPRIVAPLAELRAAGRPQGALIFALAAWMRSCLGVDEAGRPMPLSDPPLQAWQGLPQADWPTDAVVRSFLSFAPVFGANPDQRFGPSLVRDLETALAAIRDLGIRAAADRFLSQSKDTQ